MSQDTTFTRFVDALGPLMAEGISKQPESTQLLIEDTVATGGSYALVVGLDPVVVTGLLVKPGAPNVQLFQVSGGGVWH